MNSRIDELLQAALGLPDDDQLRLLAALTAALDERGLRPFDDSWLVEARRRSAEFDAELVQPIPWSQVKQRSRDRIAREPDGG